MKWLRPKARPPENVRVVLADGTEVPVSCVYAGWYDNAHQWAVIVPPGLAPVSMSVGMLPGRAALRVSLATKVEEER